MEFATAAEAWARSGGARFRQDMGCMDIFLCYVMLQMKIQQKNIPLEKLDRVFFKIVIGLFGFWDIAAYTTCKKETATLVGQMKV